MSIIFKIFGQPFLAFFSLIFPSNLDIFCEELSGYIFDISLSQLLSTWADSRPVLKDHHGICQTFARPHFSKYLFMKSKVVVGKTVSIWPFADVYGLEKGRKKKKSHFPGMQSANSFQIV